MARIPEMLYPQPTEIRPASLADIPNIIDVQKKTWMSTYAGKGNITVEDIQAINFNVQERAIREVLKGNTEERYWIAENNSSVVGYCHAIGDSGCKQIKNLYIYEEYQHQGIGTQMMETMLQFLGTDEPVLIEVLAVNDPAIRFYKQFGFVIMGRRISKTFVTYSHKMVEVVQMIRAAGQTDITEA